ncbi:MAG: nicotinate (nicotinamide) nucleotide adenylyltransferase [Ideonella sp.]|nr:nicotinate (nicotinamide) nucleotide adenylyltransferase [Ideonella sp.]MCC7455696.1 nicotinate (nicotinamide) nucleotide adenylyltransferase [Nitrospira sp.]
MKAETNARRIGLFGGTFDPPQLAHVALARAALDALRLDELRWIPTGRPWQKARTITEAVHREAMVRLAIAGEPRFRLERCELERSGPSVTLDTVRELQQRDGPGQWIWVMGRDQYVNLHTWRGWRELLQRVALAVADRPGITAAVDPQVAAYPHTMVPLPPMPLSATDIRARVARGEAIAGLVPDAVAGYIDRHHLYRG